ncbi:MAG: right-handed parallel beta-helix repeat-containing protein [Candidatus Bathyarchaeota archaeon]|nr:right-handed parallel beta-helix repeat-containing protein [Candidatus Bathyarchaeota archaeon]
MKRQVSSGMLLTLLFAGMFTLALRIPLVFGSETIYIRADGSVDPPTAPIQRVGNIYTFTDDIYNSSIVVQRDGITLDGHGHRLQGPTTGSVLMYGIYLSSRNDVTITNIVILDGFTYGILLDCSSYCGIVNNDILGVDCRWGIKLLDSRYNLLADNTIMNTYKAIELVGSSYNTLSNNKIIDNTHGIWLSATYYPSTGNTLRNNVMAANKHNFLVYSHFDFMSGYINDVDTSNTVDGKPIYYWINRHDESIPLDAGCVVIVNSSRMTVKDLRLRNTGYGVCLAYTENSIIENVTATVNYGGIALELSRYNVITRNNLTDNDGPGIFLDLSCHNSLIDNFVQNTNSSGIWLEDCGGGGRGGSPGYNTLIGNTVLYSRTGKPQEWDGAGILVDDSNYCTVIENNVTSNSYGIVVGATPASNNQISRNAIVMNDVGLFLGACSDNAIYHNNFIDNKLQVEAGKGMWVPGYNIFDSGYPSGGNYWSDYGGADVKKGPQQDQPGSDLVGDTPYIPYDNNLDHYPLMNPFGSPPSSTYTLTVSAAANGTTNPGPGTYTYFQGQAVPVQAIPDTGYLLDHWDLDGANVDAVNPISVPMNVDHTVHPVFMLAYTLTLTTTAGGITNPLLGTYMYGAGTIVSVSATPYPGYYFDHWTLDDVHNTTNPLTVTMNMDHTLRAVFARIQYTLVLTTTVGGTTDPTPGTYTYASDTLVNVMAQRGDGYYLDGWELDSVDIGIHNPVRVIMNGNHTVHAVFKQLRSGHDVALKGGTSKTVVGRGYPLAIPVTAMNIGSYPETFNVTGSANTTLIDTVTSITLPSGAFTAILVTWDTTSVVMGNYTITVEATPVPGETDTADNTLPDHTVMVTVPGDVNGDGKVRIDDILAVALAFGLDMDDPTYDPNLDVNGDDKIRIDDVLIVVVTFGLG